MRKWTMKELRETDDLTFAMAIMRERSGKLNPNAPLMKKLNKAVATLDAVRGGSKMPPGMDELSFIRTYIFYEVDKEHKLGDICGILENESSRLDLQGLKPEEVIADEQMMKKILRLLEMCGCGDDYWIGVDSAIENGIRDVLAERRDCDGETN